MEEPARQSSIRGLFRRIHNLPFAKIVEIAGGIAGIGLLVFAIGDHVGWFNSEASTSTTTIVTPAQSTPSSKTTSGSATSTQALTGPVYLDGLTPVAGTNPDNRGEVNVGGMVYPHGLQYQFRNADCPPYSVSTTYGIPRGAKAFAAVIGNDANQTNPFWTQWHLTYSVAVDGLTEYEGHASGGLHDPGPTLSVAGHTRLELKITVDCPAGGVLSDWGNPAFS
jgi:hypothetical protein